MIDVILCGLWSNDVSHTTYIFLRCGGYRTSKGCARLTSTPTPDARRSPAPRPHVRHVVQSILPLQDSFEVALLHTSVLCR